MTGALTSKIVGLVCKPNKRFRIFLNHPSHLTSHAAHSRISVTTCINCIDQERKEWTVGPRMGKRMHSQRYVFHHDRFSESPLFKIPETYRGEVLLVEGLHDPEEEFRYLVEQAGLKGLIFEELWSDEE
jgi:hypothetical protein